MMKRPLFIILLTVCSVSQAEWRYVNKTNDSDWYADKSTIRKDGAISRMWTLSDYFEEQTNSSGKKFKSDKTRWAFNCQQDAFTITTMVMYSDSMGTGDVVFSKTWQEEWEPIVPGSIIEMQWKIACGKK